MGTELTPFACGWCCRHGIDAEGNMLIRRQLKRR
jgi:hypothetical protein